MNKQEYAKILMYVASTSLEKLEEKDEGFSIINCYTETFENAKNKIDEAFLARKTPILLYNEPY